MHIKMDSWGIGGREPNNQNNRNVTNANEGSSTTDERFGHLDPDDTNTQIAQRTLQQQLAEQLNQQQRFTEQLNEQHRQLRHQQLLRLRQNQQMYLEGYRRNQSQVMMNPQYQIQSNQNDFLTANLSNPLLLSTDSALLRQQQLLMEMQRHQQYYQPNMERQPLIQNSISQRQQLLQQQRLLNQISQHEQRYSEMPDIDWIDNVGGTTDTTRNLQSYDLSVARLPVLDTPNTNPLNMNVPYIRRRDPALLEQLLQQERQQASMLDSNREIDTRNSYTQGIDRLDHASMLVDRNLNRIESRLTTSQRNLGDYVGTGGGDFTSLQGISTPNWKVAEPKEIKNIKDQPLQKTETTAKRKATSRKKLPGMPKRPLHAYNIYFQEERQKILSEIPSPTDSEKEAERTDSDGKPRSSKQKRRSAHGKISFASLAKEIGYKWHNLEKEKKEHYQQLAEIDLQRYDNELDAYNRKIKKQNKLKQKQEAQQDELDTKPSAGENVTIPNQGTPTSDEVDEDDLSTTAVVAKKKKL